MKVIESAMTKTIALFGGGGHASVIADMLLKLGYKIEVLVDKQLSLNREVFNDIPVISDDVFISRYSPEAIKVANGLGFVPGSHIRKAIFEKLKTIGFVFETVVSKDAIVSSYSVLGEGVQVLPGAIIQPGVRLGENTIINTGVIIEHDSIVGNNCHISPGGVLCGGVTCGDNVFVGANATVIQNITIGDESIIGSAALVRKNILPNSTFY